MRRVAGPAILARTLRIATRGVGDAPWGVTLTRPCRV
jgi:hypothetical protein